MNIIEDIQKRALHKDYSVTDLLRFAKVAAVKLVAKEMEQWIDRELSGYMDLQADDLPPYRRLTGQPKAYNPYHGWQSILSKDPDIIKAISQAPIGVAIGSIEAALASDDGSDGIFPYDSEVKSRIISSLDYPADVANFVSRSSMVGIVDAVRNLVLNWTLELEKAGVTGNGLRFSRNEVEKSQGVTQNYYINQIGNIGSFAASGGTTEVGLQNVNSISLDFGKIEDLISQIQDNIAGFPPDVQSALNEGVKKIASELEKEEPNEEKTRKKLISIKDIVEGASGSLLAAGVIQTIRAILGI